MRILHVFDHSLPLQSGYVTRSLAILRSQKARGWKTTHLTAPRHESWGGGAEPYATDDGLQFERTPASSVTFPALRELAEMRILRRRIAQLIAADRPDIVHAHSPVLNALPAIAAAGRAGLPVVYEVRALWEDAAVDHGRSREGDLRYRLSRWLDSRALLRANAVVALCEPLRREIVGRGVAAERVTVVPNAVDPQFFAPAGDADPELRRSLGLPDAPVLGFIGSFYAYEGLELLLEATSILRRQGINVAVLLVGGGPEEKRLREQVQRLGLDDRVRFAGRVPLEAVPRYYPLIDVLVFPRRRMRLTELVTPLKPLEAMAQRRPLIASDVGGHRELIRDNETGILVPPDDADALARGIAHVIADPARRQQMAEEGRRFVESERNWEAVCSRYEAVYERLLANGAGRGNP